MPVLVRELLTLYAHKADCAALPRVTPYRDYLAWVARHRAGACRPGGRLWRGWKRPRVWPRHDPGRAAGGAGADHGLR